MNNEHRACGKSAGTLTCTEASKAQKTPRLPPITYAMFLEMLFGDENEHLNGLCGGATNGDDKALQRMHDFGRFPGGQYMVQSGHRQICVDSQAP